MRITTISTGCTRHWRIFRSRELWIGRDEETPAFLSLLNEARARGTTIVQQIRGHDFDWDGVKARVLWPADISEVTKPSNDDSLVMTLDDGIVNFLLPGDIEKKVENELVAEDAPLKADFLKVPHHGSKTSSTDAFVAAVAPKFAVVSVGDGNQFGHPVDSVVARYAAAGVRFLRTDRDGEVTALSGWSNADGANFCGRPPAVDTTAEIWNFDSKIAPAIRRTLAPEWRRFWCIPRLFCALLRLAIPSTKISVPCGPSGFSGIGNGSEETEPGESMPALCSRPRITIASVTLSATWATTSSSFT